MHKTWKCHFTQKHENTQKLKCKKCQNGENEKCDLPLRPENTIPYRGRGTPHKPQNVKMPPPAPTENTKCQKVPFIWHFGHFGVFLKMSLFSLFHFWFFTFYTFSLFWFSDFVIFHVFVILWFLLFLWFLSILSKTRFFTVFTDFSISWRVS